MESRSKGNSEPLDIVKNAHVSELYLARRQITDVPDLSRFTQLRYIWLNNNRIKRIHGPVFHCCLSELYLQNNEITSISEALRHLHCLCVLLLHNNHLLNLEETVHELRNMQQLQTLKVRQEERRRAFKLLSPEKQTILDTVAFGRGAPAERKTIASTKRGNETAALPDGCPFDEIEGLCERTAMQKSIVQFSTLVWSSMRRAHQHPLEEYSSTAATILTVEFR